MTFDVYIIFRKCLSIFNKGLQQCSVHWLWTCAANISQILWLMNPDVVEFEWLIQVKKILRRFWLNEEAPHDSADTV